MFFGGFFWTFGALDKGNQILSTKHGVGDEYPIRRFWSSTIGLIGLGILYSFQELDDRRTCFFTLFFDRYHNIAQYISRKQALEPKLSES